MTARIYATDAPLPSGQRPELARLIPITAATLDEALVRAARLFQGGAVVWCIEDPSQTLDDPASIVAACQRRGLLPYTWRPRRGS
jgi:hypothetical protein